MARDVGEWLAKLGLAKYAELFAENEVGFDALPHLSEADLKELGLPLGPRKVLLAAIAALDVTETTQSDRTAASPAGAERRQLTVMFCDLVGSTALSTRTDPEEMRDIIRDYQNAVAGEVARFDGHVAKFMGDGVLAYFGWPVAHEDDGERAVRASMSIMQTMTNLKTPRGDALAARIGIATGLVVVGDLVGEGASQEEAVVGETPNLAARLQAIAEPGQAVIAEATRRLLGGAFELDEPAPQRLKGLDAPVITYVVRGERTLESRFEARTGPALMPMVGRDQELALLLERWHQATASDGHGVLVVGEAGIGKSRLTRALLDAVAAEPHTRLRYQCSPYHTDSALWPSIQQLTFGAGIAADDSNDVKLDKIEALLSQGSEDISEAAPLVADLLGVDGQARYGKLDLSPREQRTRTHDVLTDQLLGLAATRPVLLILEDAHWIDPTMQELIEQCLDHIGNAKVLMLLTSRPDNEPKLAAHPAVTRFTLNRLARAGVEEIVSRLRGSIELPAEVINEIISRTDGVPLFIEELTQAILETGETTIPASLHDSLMARLDHIPEVKEVAQMAACIGREFDFPLLAAFANKPGAEIVSGLDKLASVGLVYKRGTLPDAHYTFKHALVRDAAYESLLRRTRQRYHRKIAQGLEERFGEIAEKQPELVAQHYAAAGADEAASTYWERAGRLAIRRSAYQEAVGHLSHAIVLVAKMAPAADWRRRELELQVELGQALIASQGYSAPPTAAAFTRAKELAEQLGDTPLLLPTIYGEWVVRYIRADPTAEYVSRFLRATERSDDSGARLVALRTLALERFHSGQLTRMLEIVEQILERYDRTKHRDLALRYGHDPRMATLCYKAWSLCYLGFPEQADTAARSAIEWALELNHGNTTAMAYCWGGMIFNAMQRQSRRVEELAHQALPVTDAFSLPLWHGWSRAFLGWSLAQRGEISGGIREIEAGLAESQETGAGRLRPLILGLLAEAELLKGDHGAAEVTIAEALQESNRQKDVGWEAELHRIRAQTMLHSSVARTDLAEDSLRKSLDIARAQQARLIELRTATDLARIWGANRDRLRAVELLQPIYGWFTEGFETPDLKEAKTLLDDLG